MIRNIDAYQLKKSSKGNGGSISVPHHKMTMNGKLTQLYRDGCYKNPDGTCETCSLPVEECTGNFKKNIGGANWKKK